MSKESCDYNTEDKIEDFGDIYEWLNTMNEIPITNQMITTFFRGIFRLLEVNDMCFSSGAFVFENLGNILFNLLTFNKLLVNDGAYCCDYPLTRNNPNLPKPELSVPPASGVYIIGTDTHRKHYEKFKTSGPIQAEPRDCMPAKHGKTQNIWPNPPSKEATKFERVLNPRLKNLCGICDATDKDELSEPKGVILYYPFTITSLTYPTDLKTPKTTISQMLYVKFEAHSVTTGTIGHVISLGQRITGTKKIYDRYPSLRREDSRSPECIYNEMYKRKDIEFYRAYCPQDMRILDWYNDFARTGCEFFVSANLLKYFLKTFLFKPFDCVSAKNISQFNAEKSQSAIENPDSEITEGINPSQVQTTPIESATEPPEPPAPPAPPAQLNSEEIGCRSIDYTYRTLVNDYQNPKDTAYTGIIGQIQSYFDKHPEIKCKYKSTYTIDDLSAIHKACSINNVSEIKNIICQPSGGRKTRKIRKNKKTKKNKKINKRKRKTTHKKI